MTVLSMLKLTTKINRVTSSEFLLFIVKLEQILLFTLVFSATSCGYVYVAVKLLGWLKVGNEKIGARYSKSKFSEFLEKSHN